jgi:hypothetical protein
VKRSGKLARVGIDGLETWKTIQRTNETTSWFFEKKTKMNKPLAKLTKERGNGIKLIKVEMRKGIQRIL